MGSAQREISHSFAKLRRLLDTFQGLSDGRPASLAIERRAARWAEELGGVAVPMLARKLRSEHDGEAAWAYFLLSRIGGPRAAEAARRLALDPSASDGSKALALALLAELGAEVPESVTLRDSRALRERSVRELLDSLVEPADVARAADLLVEQVAPSDLGGFLSDMAEVAGARVLPLCEELLLRDDLDPIAARDVRSLAERLAPFAAPAPRPPRRRRSVLGGQRADGERVVVAVARRAGPPARLRAIIVQIGRDARLRSLRYEGALAVRSGERRLAESLAADGFLLSPCPPAEASALVLEAIRRERRERGRVPRAFYLGRDLLGLTDEHARGARQRPADEGELERAQALIARGQAARAKPLLDRHVDRWPDDAEGRTAMGSCLLALGRIEEALLHFAVAACLEPDDAIRHWNLAYVHKRAGKLGACYLSLVRYLELGDTGIGAAERRRAAGSYVRLFEQFARLEHPDATAENVARAEELFERAFQHLAARRYADAASGFEAVLKLVPSHYPSWGNLGVALLSQGDRPRAEHCWRKALEFRPDYEIARKNLAAITE